MSLSYCASLSGKCLQLTIDYSRHAGVFRFVRRSICDEIKVNGDTSDCPLEVVEAVVSNAAETETLWHPQEAPAFWRFSLSLAESAFCFM